MVVVTVTTIMHTSPKATCAIFPFLWGGWHFLYFYTWEVIWMVPLANSANSSLWGLIFISNTRCKELVILQLWLWQFNLCKKESQVKSKKTAWSHKKSRKSHKKQTFPLTFHDWKLFVSTLPDFLFYRDSTLIFLPLWEVDGSAKAGECSAQARQALEAAGALSLPLPLPLPLCVWVVQDGGAGSPIETSKWCQWHQWCVNDAISAMMHNLQLDQPEEGWEGATNTLLR